MSELRAEAVKEALEIWDGYPEGDSGDPVFVIVDAARAWLAHSCVAALIAEGGEIKADDEGWVEVSRPGRYLLYPIPVESAEAKETP